ncbi:MAG: putative glyoxylase [Gammaproteobacteria bacterium]|jgi:predicted enzyme related to lactoylglutathione lyase|nr:putative glyoxylase [Gammaproteobacteria bacterium]
MSNAEIRGRFVWHELMTTDTDAASDFYSNVVPWKTQDSGMPSYTLWMSGKYQAGGLSALPQEEASAPPHWIIYIGTPDVDATVEAAEKLGGKVIKAASDVPNVGRFAVLSDPQGAAFAVFTPLPVSGDVAPGGGVGDFTWHELATTDPEAAFAFYSELFGWSKGAAHEMGEMGVYQLVSHGGQDVGGVFKARDNSTPPSWLSYVRVADATKAAGAAKAAGGRILNGPMEVPGGSWIVQILDPQGGAFAVVEAAKAAKAGAQKAAGKPAAKKAVKKAPAKKAPATVAKGAPAKAAPAKKSAAAKKGAAKKGAAKKGAAKKGAAKKAVGKKPALKRAAAKKSTPAKRGPVAKKGAKVKAKGKAKSKAKSKK